TSTNTVSKEIPIDATPRTITVAPPITTLPACPGHGTTPTTQPGSTTTSTTTPAGTATTSTTTPAGTATTSPTMPAVTTTTLPVVQTCATARDCLDDLPASRCSETINPKLQKVIRAKLGAAKAALGKAAAATKPKKVAKFSKKAKASLTAIQTKAGKFTTVR